jgi:2-polyprenyl-6-methoxyphenol hydroxylase-like FAD-dependent oxidoreductase
MKPLRRLELLGRRANKVADVAGEPLPASTAVLIAGGGPVGLATAVELAYHGIPSVVIERREEVSWLRPRAKTTSARTMEHFRRWGLATNLREQAPLPVAWSKEAVFCTSLLGREITRIDDCFGLELASSDLVAECGQQVPQPVVEQVLRDAITSMSETRLCRGFEVTGVEQIDELVRVDVVDRDGVTHQIEAQYVVGCEGARSIVRDTMGARYEGSESGRPNFNIVFRAPHLAERVPHGPAVHYWILNPAQPGLMGRLDLKDLWWCIAQGVDAKTGEANTHGLVHNLIGDDVPISILASDAWQARMLLADRYASKRLFLAGDSAHQNPPWGGHGFNTGIGDGVNIGWKLAAVLNGWAPSELLATYELERRPVAARTINEAARNMSNLAPELSDVRLAGSDSEFGQAQPSVATAIHATKEGEFHSLGLTLGYSYQGSPIVDGSEASQASEENDTYRPTAAPGYRLPHRWLGPEDSLYDHLGREFSLVGNMSAPLVTAFVTTAEANGVPLNLVDLKRDERNDVLGADLVLVRPDHHVAWRGNDDADPAHILRRSVGYLNDPPPPVDPQLERIM